jgi:hypothetical protein
MWNRFRRPFLLLGAATIAAAGCNRGDRSTYDAELPAGATRADSMAAGAAIQTPPPLDGPVSPNPATMGTAPGAAAPAGGAQDQPGVGPGADTAQTHGAPVTRP